MQNRQLEHTEVKNTIRKFPLVVICENIESPENVGMVFRNCEAMGVEEIIFTGSSIRPPNRKIRKISRATDRSVKHSYTSSTITAIEELRKQNYEIIAIEITENSESLPECRFYGNKKYAFIVGSEKHGIEETTLHLVDKSAEIPLYGNNTSINVVSALTIALYEISKQLSVS